jgi:hypothetical protein
MSSKHLWLAFRVHDIRQALRHYKALYMYPEAICYAYKVIKVPGKQGRSTLTLPPTHSLQFRLTAILLEPYNIFVAKAQENDTFSPKYEKTLCVLRLQ